MEFWSKSSAKAGGVAANGMGMVWDRFGDTETPWFLGLRMLRLRWKLLSMFEEKMSFMLRKNMTTYEVTTHVIHTVQICMILGCCLINWLFINFVEWSGTCPALRCPVPFPFSCLGSVAFEQFASWRHVEATSIDSFVDGWFLRFFVLSEKFATLC